MTDLIAQAEAALDGVTPGEWIAVDYTDTDEPAWHVVPSDYHGTIASLDPEQSANARFIAWCRAGVPALIARIRELEGANTQFWEANLRLQRELDARIEPEIVDQMLDIAQPIMAEALASETERADAAEAKLAEVEKERDEAGQLALTLQAEAESLHEELTDAQATIATLTAQVEAMRGELTEANRRLGGGCDANAGGDHHVITQGNYHFCAKCGESLKGIRFCHMPRAALTTDNQTNG